MTNDRATDPSRYSRLDPPRFKSADEHDLFAWSDELFATYGRKCRWSWFTDRDDAPPSPDRKHSTDEARPASPSSCINTITHISKEPHDR